MLLRPINSFKSGLIVFICMLSAGVIAPLQDSHAQSNEEVVSYTDLRAQGMLYFKRGLFRQARLQFEKAFKMDEGPRDLTMVFAMAKTYAKLARLKQAFAFGERALDMTTPNMPMTKKVKVFMDELSNQYGPVEIRSAQDNGLIYLHAESAFLNPNKRRVFESVRIRLSTQSVTFPTVIYLPFGNYSANSVAFSVSGKQVDTVSIFIRAIDTQPTAGRKKGSRLWWYVGATAALAAAGVGAWAYFRDHGNDSSSPTTYNIQILNLVTE